MAVYVVASKAMPMLVFKMARVAVAGTASAAPPVGLERNTERLSVPSAVAVLRTCTAKVLTVSPSPKDKMPFVATYFTPATAVPSSVLKPTVTVPAEPFVRTTVMMAFV